MNKFSILKQIFLAAIFCTFQAITLLGASHSFTPQGTGACCFDKFFRDFNSTHNAHDWAQKLVVDRYQSNSVQQQFASDLYNKDIEELRAGYTECLRKTPASIERIHSKKAWFSDAKTLSLKTPDLTVSCTAQNGDHNCSVDLYERFYQESPLVSEITPEHMYTTLALMKQAQDERVY